MNRFAWFHRAFGPRLRAFWPYLLVVPLALVQFGGHIGQTKVAPDETGWIRASATVALLVLQGDFKPSSWQADPDNVYGYSNPQLGKFFFALPLMYNLMSGAGALPPLPEPYDFTKSREENDKEKRLPPAYILKELRLVAVVAGVALCCVCMRIAQVLCGGFCAVLAGLLLVFNPTMISVSSAVMTDGIYQAFTLLAVLCAMRLSGSESRPEARKWTIRTGAAAALAGAVKFAAPIILFPYYFVLLLSARFAPRISIAQALAILSGFSVVYLVVTFMLNPFLWPDPSGYGREAFSREWRLLNDGDIDVVVGTMPPVWFMDLRLDFEDSAQSKNGKLCYQALTESSRETLVSHLWTTQLYPFHATNRHHPARIVPVLYEISRPLQLPIMYLRWYVFKDMLFSGGKWKLPSMPNFIDALAFRSSILPVESLWALAGLGILVWRMRRCAARERHQIFAFLMFVPIAFLFVYATRLADIHRYLLLLFMLRNIAAAVAVHAMAVFIFTRLRAAFPITVRIPS